jgi:hypothetical protein
MARPKGFELLGQLGRHSIIPAMKCELGHTRSGLRAIFSTPKGLILGLLHGAIEGDVVSQKREGPDAPLHGSCGQNDGGNTR